MMPILCGDWIIALLSHCGVARRRHQAHAWLAKLCVARVERLACMNVGEVPGSVVLHYSILEKIDSLTRPSLVI